VRSLIIDDEAPARSRLARLLADHAEIEVIGEAKNGLDAVEKIEKLRPELLFLDIEMPGLGGFDVLRSIESDVSLPLVIFITGYDQHALEAFEANALAYLLKPVEPDRLAVAIERAVRLSARGEDKKSEEKKIARLTRDAPRALRQIVCRKRDRLVLVPPSQIFWFEAEGGIVKARTATDTFTVNYQLNELESALPQDLFFRARRETLVNMTRVKEIRPYFKSGFLLVMSDNDATEIAVSERQARPLRLRLPGL
jgi:DNA-binding LytR/AlgR family response regulator